MLRTTCSTRAASHTARPGRCPRPTIGAKFTMRPRGCCSEDAFFVGTTSTDQELDLAPHGIPASGEAVARRYRGGWIRTTLHDFRQGPGRKRGHLGSAGPDPDNDSGYVRSQETHVACPRVDTARIRRGHCRCPEGTRPGIARSARVPGLVWHGVVCQQAVLDSLVGPRGLSHLWRNPGLGRGVWFLTGTTAPKREWILLPKPGAKR